MTLRGLLGWLSTGEGAPSVLLVFSPSCWAWRRARAGGTWRTAGPHLHAVTALSPFPFLCQAGLTLPRKQDPRPSRRGGAGKSASWRGGGDVVEEAEAAAVAADKPASSQRRLVFQHLEKRAGERGGGERDKERKFSASLDYSLFLFCADVYLSSLRNYCWDIERLPCSSPKGDGSWPISCCNHPMQATFCCSRCLPSPVQPLRQPFLTRLDSTRIR